MTIQSIIKKSLKRLELEGKLFLSQDLKNHSVEVKMMDETGMHTNKI